jgi:hypothetical protein
MWAVCSEYFGDLGSTLYAETIEDHPSCFVMLWRRLVTRMALVLSFGQSWIGQNALLSSGIWNASVEPGSFEEPVYP